MGAGTRIVAGLVLATGVAAVTAVALAQPMEMPARRAGLWKMTMSGAGMPSGMTMTQCVDPATEQKHGYFPTGRGSEANDCTKKEAHKIAGGWAFEAVCSGRGGGPTSTSGTVTGDFQTHIHTVVDTKGADGERHMAMDQVWVGSCPAGGGGRTVTLPDGRTITIPSR